ncbi:alpha/beta hydrolase [Streptomyces sp. NPDC047002]|uniref:alpha/beta fold hydrolase n=1 Tax=Streptomyces sp. NPDC047002 TaxID=3155475 RepID=UPI003456FAD6
MQELAFDTLGSGPAVVLIHGTGSTPEGTWGSFPQELARTHRVILPHLPGTGQSPLPEGPLDGAAVARQIADAASRAGAERFAVAGASLGGPLAVKTAALFPDRVTHLVSVCGYAAARPSLRLREELFEAVLPLGPQAVGKLLLVFGMSDPTAAALPGEALESMTEAIGGGLAPGTREQIVLARTVDVTADLASVTAPALVVSGLQDNFVAPAHSTLLADGIPGARLLELDGGHGLVHERTAEVLTAVRDLLAR